MAIKNAAEVGELIGKTENWVKRNSPRLPHSRAGKTYFWTDEDLIDLFAALKHRPAEERPLTGPKPTYSRRRRP